MNELIIFGRSPFINTVHINRLIELYPTMGFNHFGSLWPVDYLFYFDALLKPRVPSTLVFVPRSFKKAPKEYIRYAHQESDRPLLHLIKQNGAVCLSHRYFTPSLGINWALLNGFKKLYLVGIDHIETDTRFEHHDNEPCYSELTSASHRRFKNFVYECAGHIKIYQTNPAVKDQWQLPYKDIQELYNVAQPA